MVFEGGEEGSAVNVVELFLKGPLVFGVVDLELAVWRDASNLDKPEHQVHQWRSYNWGCIALRSVPITFADGFFKAVNYLGQ